MTLDRARLYGILDLGYVAPEQVLVVLDRMLSAPIDVIQLRAKGFAEERIASLGREAAARCRAAGVTFIINDFPHLVPVTGADGVHIGQDDGPLESAREAAGPDAMLGRSTHSVDQARAAWLEGADYIGFGPLFATPTKPDYLPIGMEDISQVHRESPVPVFCIGGIKRENLSDVVAAGARRVVIVSGILQANDPIGYARECQETLASHAMSR